MIHRDVVRQVVVCGMVMAVACTSQITQCLAQQTVSLPQGWQQMSPTDFASAIRTLYQNNTFKLLSDADKVAAEDHGRDLFSQIDVANTPLNYQTLEMLHWVCRGSVDPQTADRARTALMGRQDNWAGQPYAEIRAKVVMMMRLKVPDANQITEARRWVGAGGTMDQIPKTDLQYDIVRQAFADLRVIAGSFNVQWNGLINPPATGDYKFFISPINVNSGYQERPFKFTMMVSVAGQTIINSVPDNSTNQSPWPTQSSWVSESNFITLTAGQPAAIQVTASTNAQKLLPHATLYAVLFWQGPGITKSVIPQANLALPDGSAQGLQATYNWSLNGQPQLLTRTDPTIDFSWTNSAILLAQDTTIASQAADTMWQTLTSTDFINATLGPPVTLHPFLKDPDNAAAGLSTERRQAFLDLLLQNPTLLDAMDTKGVVRFYQAFRFGNPDKALDVFGTWAGRQADLACGLSNDRVFEGDVRFSLAALAIATTQQFPDHATRLQNEFLQLQDGRCSLPVAYALAYSYLGRQRLLDWIAFLDAKLADPSVVGDLQANWLIARSHAQELRRTMYKHYPFAFPIPSTWPLEGRSYLDQALQAAQSAAIKMRVAKEIAGRLAWAHQFQAAKDVLTPLTNSLSDDQKAVLALWQQQLDGFLAAEQLALQNRGATANAAYVVALKLRRDKAVSLGDTTSVDRYNAMISAAGGSP